MAQERASLLLSLPLWGATLTACGPMALDGAVIDADGKPIVGATVSAMPIAAEAADGAATTGRLCHATSDDDGRYSVECPPGNYQVVVSAEGYTSEDLDVEAAERKRYDLGKQLLVKIPEEKGLFLKKGAAYEAMAPGHVIRTTEKDGKLTHRRFCVDPEGGGPNTLSTGLHALFDYEHPGWRPWIVDAEGCVYKDTKNEQHQWTVEYREKAAYETRQLNVGKEIALMQLPPGQYFIADWKGFFQKSPDKERKEAYTGYWLVVE
jgi:hypothetical protein